MYVHLYTRALRKQSAIEPRRVRRSLRILTRVCTCVTRYRTSAHRRQIRGLRGKPNRSTIIKLLLLLKFVIIYYYNTSRSPIFRSWAVPVQRVAGVQISGIGIDTKKKKTMNLMK